MDEQPKLNGLPKHVQYVQDAFLEAYPGSKVPSNYNCTDMVRIMNTNGWGIADFDKALIDYRDRDDKAEFCPSPITLKKYFPGKQTTTSLDRKYRFFIGCVIRDGWYKAIQSNLWATSMLKLMQYDQQIEYSGLENWLVEFCQILHHADNGPDHDPGNPAEAYAFAAQNAPTEWERQWYYKHAQYFVKGDIETQQTYFPYFRFQRYAKCSDPHLYGHNHKLQINVVGSNYAPAKFLPMSDDGIPF